MKYECGICGLVFNEQAHAEACSLRHGAARMWPAKALTANPPQAGTWAAAIEQQAIAEQQWQQQRAGYERHIQQALASMQVGALYGAGQLGDNSNAQQGAYRQQFEAEWIEESPAGVTGGSTREDERGCQGNSSDRPEEAIAAPVTPRPVCACGQEIREPVGGWKFGFPFKYCGDCRAMRAKPKDPHDLATRIAAARPAEQYGDVGPWDARDAEYEL